MTWYAIDPFTKPALVVLIGDDADAVDTVAQVYANQVGHAIVVTEGPSPEDAQYRPIVPALATPGVALLPIVEGSVPRAQLVEHEPQ